ncbi:MAG: hypothetical protein QF492_07185 [Candidatus Krumholzibacteria bacterium]|nr:hypothetical protein [Candidatus Krumholzibacteria bacterium]MDP6669669.1 hypothetical protein [Candidatus Krumholzibacteria bacterium]MDP6797561.1 hypothetical protein [Candidatus Krumholzibacteria bacterium]MDP7021236.1 hypothetical protein [Candidatus Krumholzibacteria bacterium]
MPKRRLSLALILLVLTIGCVKTVDLNTEEAIGEVDHYGNIQILDDQGIRYFAQSIVEAAPDTLTLTLVRIVDDGVISHEQEYLLPLENVRSIRYRDNHVWIVGSSIAAMALFMTWLYYRINGF